MATRTTAAPTIEQLTVNAYSIPTDAPEADGTFEWTQTTIVVVEINAGGKRGVGYTYTDVAAATLIRHTLAEVVRECAIVVPPPEDPLPCQSPAESELRASFDRGSTIAN